ncbi:MAG TPA: NUDIX domain-containing protein [Candidatus Dormibacteraeota bacterium]|nr:NUDIX domain-containing protein [Candidatus Dormibacteraeota bacterium]
MTNTSAGLLLYRLRETGPQIFLVHPGGPFWRRRDEGAWSIPKGEHDDREEGLAAALREFREETGLEAPDVEWVGLGTIRQRGGKVVAAWAGACDLDAGSVRSNTFEMEWPPGSTKMATFPEVDRAEWFDLPAARRRINPGQLPFIERLAALLAAE